MRIKATGIFLLVGFGYSQTLAQQNPSIQNSVHVPVLKKDSVPGKDTGRRPSLPERLLLPQNSAEWILTLGSGTVVMSFWLAEQQFRFTNWRQDSWSSRSGALFSKYDKVEHFGVVAAGQALLIGLDRSGLVRSSVFDRVKLSVLAITWWELKDAVAPWEQYGEWGGEGFSMRDWIASAAGIGTTELLNWALKEVF